MYTYINYPQQLKQHFHTNKINNFDVYYPWLSRINTTDVKKIFFYQFLS